MPGKPAFPGMLVYLSAAGCLSCVICVYGIACMCCCVRGEGEPEGGEAGEEYSGVEWVCCGRGFGQQDKE